MNAHRAKTPVVALIATPAIAPFDKRLWTPPPVESGGVYISGRLSCGRTYDTRGIRRQIILARLCIPSIVQVQLRGPASSCRRVAVRPWLRTQTVRSHFRANILLIKAAACAFGNVGEVDEWLSRALRIIPVFRTVPTIPIHPIIHEQMGGEQKSAGESQRLQKGNCKNSLPSTH